MSRVDYLKRMTVMDYTRPGEHSAETLPFIGLGFEFESEAEGVKWAGVLLPVGKDSAQGRHAVADALELLAWEIRRGEHLVTGETLRTGNEVNAAVYPILNEHCPVEKRLRMGVQGLFGPQVAEKKRDADADKWWNETVAAEKEAEAAADEAE